MAIADYHASAGDWRAQLKKNQRRTRQVIALFLLIYLLVGVVADTVMMSSMQPNLPIDQIFIGLLTFKYTPVATLIMVGLAIISLLITFTLYDRIMLLGTDYKEITPETAQTIQEKQLYNVVEEMKVAAGLKFMPKVFLINADYMNAFASGYSEKSAMVAITRGLIEKLDRAELQAVMAHELSHIRHQDIKLTLAVAVLSNILLIVIDILFYSIVFKRERREDNRLLMVVMVLRYVLPIITLLLTLFLSRTREYMADAGCVELMRDNEPMARALLKISQDHQQHAEQYAEDYGQTPHEQVRQASYLFDPSSIDPVKSLSSSFSTHPSVEQRLKALGFKRK
ncbi:MAG TPA: zinc metalloprotease HtpX [Legionella sp.]|nr:zinc metalloprotease HtpX [Legionella sp.]